MRESITAGDQVSSWVMDGWFFSPAWTELVNVEGVRGFSHWYCKVTNSCHSIWCYLTIIWQIQIIQPFLSMVNGSKWVDLSPAPKSLILTSSQRCSILLRSVCLVSLPSSCRFQSSRCLAASSRSTCSMILRVLCVMLGRFMGKHGRCLLALVLTWGV